MTTVGPGHFPYDADSAWADPDLDVAAAMMRRVVESPVEARERASRAQARVIREFTPERTGQFIRDRLAAVRETAHPSAVASGSRASWSSLRSRLKR
jgi:hypothetical protein